MKKSGGLSDEAETFYSDKHSRKQRTQSDARCFEDECKTCTRTKKDARCFEPSKL